MSFDITNNVLTKYTEDDKQDLVIPDGVTEIADRAFANCRKIKSAVIPPTVKRIGMFAFQNCISLAKIFLSGESMSFETAAFYNCTALKEVYVDIISHWMGYTFDNLQSNPLCYAHQLFISGKDADCSVISPDTKIIGDYSFSKCDTIMLVYASAGQRDTGKITAEGYVQLSALRLPESISEIKDTAFTDSGLRVIMPHSMLRSKNILPNNLIDYMDDIDITDSVYLFMYQKKSDYIDLAKNNLINSPDGGVSAILGFLKSNTVSSNAMERFADLTYLVRNTLDNSVIKEVISALQSISSSEPVKRLSDYVDASVTDSNKDRSIEQFCIANFDIAAIEKSSKEYDFKFNAVPVHIKDSGEIAAELVVKCALIPYFGMEDSAEHYRKFGFNDDADSVIEKLDKDDLSELITTNCDIDFMYKNKTRCLIVPLCRVCDGKTISSLISAIRKWKNWSGHGSAGRRAIKIAKVAILFNDSREAIIFADKDKELNRYAWMRNTTADDIRDNVLTDFGFDENGKIQYDLGPTVIEASVGKDLKIRLFNTEAGKDCKSLPKRDADPEKYNLASKHLADLRKNVKAVAKSRNERLFSFFLNGDGITADRWKNSYLKNVILQHVAELIVWDQNGNTFILSDGKTVNSSGEIYTLDNESIKVAHPMEMNKSDIDKWQKYFTSHNLKQPFEQIWEQIVDFNKVETDRYAGIEIPYYRFANREKDGIIVMYANSPEDLEIRFADCSSSVGRTDSSGPSYLLQMTDKFEISSFSVDKKNRQSNHIVAYLDRISVYDRILKDDVSVMNYMGSFTLAQITDFINTASENNCNNVVAALLDYKNKTFPDFNPMDEFVL